MLGSVSLLGAALAGSVVASRQPAPLVIAAVAVGILLITIGIQQYRRPTSNIFEPIYLLLLILFGMHVTRPLSLFLKNSPETFKGYRIDHNYAEAYFLTCIGILSLLAGYFINRTPRVPAQAQITTNTWNSESLKLTVLFLSGIATLLFAVFVRQAGGPMMLLSGRSSGGLDVLSRSSAYLWSAPLMFFPCALAVYIYALQSRSRKLMLLAALIQLPQLVLAVSTGARIQLLPITLAYLAVYYLHNRRKPPAILMLVVMYLVLTVGLNFFTEIRVANSDGRRHWQTSLTTIITSPTSQLQNVFWDGESNDMFVSLAAELTVVPEQLPFSPIRFLYSTAAKVVPSVFWAGKPIALEEYLAHVMYPAERATTRTSSSPGLIGYAYLFAGPFGIMLFMFTVGQLCRRAWGLYCSNPQDPYAIGMVALTLGFVAIVLRGGVGDSLSRALFIIVPFIVIDRVARFHGPGGPVNQE